MDTAADAPRYKISDLVRMTGVGRETIRFYVNEGLLPRPEKTARNMAWYSQRHVDLIRLIRRLQEEEFLPLKVIRGLLRDTDKRGFSARQVEILVRMRRQLGELDRPERPRRELNELAALLGLSAGDLAAFREMGLLRENAGVLTEEEETILSLWARIRDAGLTPERGLTPHVLGVVQEAVEMLFERELAVFRGHLGDLDDKEAEALLCSVIPDLNRLFELLHRRRIRTFVSSLTEGDSPDR